MKKYPHLPLAQAHAGVVHIRLHAGEWEAYTAADTLPEPTIFQRRDAKWTAIKEYRDALAKWTAIKEYRDALSEDGGYSVTVNGVQKWFHSDQRSKTQQLSLFVMGAAVPAVQWKTMDGSFVTMSQSLAAQIFQAAAAQDMAIFAAAEAHRAAMKAAADPDTYDFSGGWPAVYVG